MSGREKENKNYYHLFFTADLILLLINEDNFCEEYHFYFVPTIEDLKIAFLIIYLSIWEIFI